VALYFDEMSLVYTNNDVHYKPSIKELAALCVQQIIL